MSLNSREKNAWFCGLFLEDWDKVDFLHVTRSDEFFIKDLTVNYDCITQVSTACKKIDRNAQGNTV